MTSPSRSQQKQILLHHICSFLINLESDYYSEYLPRDQNKKKQNPSKRRKRNTSNTLKMHAYHTHTRIELGPTSTTNFENSVYCI